MEINSKVRFASVMKTAAAGQLDPIPLLQGQTIFRQLLPYANNL